MKYEKFSYRFFIEISLLLILVGGLIVTHAFTGPNANPPSGSGSWGIGCMLNSIANTISVPSGGGGAFTTLSWDTEVLNSMNCHSTVTNPSRITIPAGYGGKWRIEFAIQWNPTAGNGQIELGIIKNGASTILDPNYQTTPSSFISFGSVSKTVVLSAGDYIEFKVAQSTGNNLTFYQNGQGVVGSAAWFNAIYEGQ
jgi:hypothetical protein